jgi:3-deoxy-7-phosphoheptulonate synthase
MQKNGTIDKNIKGYDTLMSPRQLITDLPRTDAITETTESGRQFIRDILDGADSRKFVIVGPCSIHDVDAAHDYATRLKEIADAVKDRLVIIMRSYFEKPRTSLGWKGLIYDPALNGEGDIKDGLHLSRKILIQALELGLPCATEYLETFTPQYNSDLVSWAAIGARTTESPQHRQLASGLSMPVGFKNNTQGDISVAVNAILSAQGDHSFLGIDEYGSPSVVTTAGNQYTHIVLRGSNTVSNYDTQSVRNAQQMLTEAGLPPNVMVDCSHGNSEKEYEKQPVVFEEVLRQIRDGNDGIVGIMLESNLKAGNQKIPADLRGFEKSDLEYGVSVTDACIDWETTALLLKAANKSLATSRT